MKTRRIILGMLHAGGWWVHFGQLTSQPCRWQITWRGTADWCQPWQFATDAALRAAVTEQLAQAGLRLVDWELPAVAPGGYADLWCVVARLHQPHHRSVRKQRMIQGWANRLVQASALAG